MYVTVLFFTFAMKQFIFIKLQFQFFVCRKNLIHRVCSIAMYHSDHKESACNAGEPGPIPWLEYPLEKKMAAPFQILAWRIPWTEEPGRLQTLCSQRVRHN